MAYLRLQNDQQAVIDFNKAVELGINDTGVFYIRGLAYLNLENYEAAVASLNEASAREPNNPAYFKVLGGVNLPRFSQENLKDRFTESRAEDNGKPRF